MKSFTVTVTIKRLLLFGIPSLAVILFFITGFFMLNSQNLEMRGIIDRNNAGYQQIVGKHQIVVKGVVTNLETKGDEIFIRLNNQVHNTRYVCVVADAHRARQELNKFADELETGRSNILVVAGFLAEKPRGNTIALYKTTVIGGAYEPVFDAD
ncbi:hypothetical protein F4Y93_04950 [Candidatus Poribacteria bacterium]|nr:hypothetical protein [Candidatus Poribacteria bacterium]